MAERKVGSSDKRIADWDNVSIELLRGDDGKCLVNCCGIGIGWLRMRCFVEIEVFPAVKRA